MGRWSWNIRFDGDFEFVMNGDASGSWPGAGSSDSASHHDKYRY